MALIDDLKEASGQKGIDKFPEDEYLERYPEQTGVVLGLLADPDYQDPLRKLMQLANDQEKKIVFTDDTDSFDMIPKFKLE